MDTFRLLADRVAVKVIEPEKISQGGIVLPDTAQEKPQTAKVVAVGPGTKKDPMTVHSGNVVYFNKYAGVDIEVNGVTLKVLKLSDIIAVGLKND